MQPSNVDAPYTWTVPVHGPFLCVRTFLLGVVYLE